MSGRAEEVPVRTYEGISYISGGATKDERETLKPNYPLKLVFAGTTGHLLSGVQVKIESKGKKVFEAAADGGPWLFVSLKPGSYNVSATYRGVTKAGVTVGKGTRRSFSPGRSRKRPAREVAGSRVGRTGFSPSGCQGNSSTKVRGGRLRPP
jgi:hypothetical protein